MIGNYQKIGLYETGMLSLLMPLRASAEFNFDDKTFELTPRPPLFTNEVISYYQTAAYLYKNDLYREVSPKEQAKYSAESVERHRDTAVVRGDR